MGLLKFFESGGSEVLTICRPITGKQGKDIVFKAEALVQYHFKIDPDTLTDEQFSKYWQRLRFALEFEQKRFSLKENESLKL